MVMVQYKFVCAQLRNCSNHAKKFDSYKVPSKLGNATAPNDPTRCDRIATPLTGIQPQLPPQFPSIPMQIARVPPLASKDCHKSSLVEEFRNSTRSTPLLPAMPLMSHQSCAPPPRRSARDRRTPQRFTDYVVDFCTFFSRSIVTLFLKLPIIEFIFG